VSNSQETKTDGVWRILPLLFFLGLAALVIRNAWLSDDAYITFRTVDNFIHGYGLTWNVAERVQSYTHPLWMLLLSAAYAVTRESFFTSMLLSIGISLATAALIAWRMARAPLLACLGLAVLMLSKAAVDYATSGLENPLTHALLVGFLLLYLKDDACTPRRLGWLSLIAALGGVNRLDTLLLYLPALAYAALQVWLDHSPQRHRERRVSLFSILYPVVLGFLPLILWEVFSLFYYGFPFPNTAYAKLTAALITRQALMAEGIAYLHNSLRADSITLAAIGAALLLVLFRWEWKKAPLALGMALYLFYTVSVGGDFMSGRFLTAPLYVAVTLLVSLKPDALKPRYQAALLLVALIVGVGAPYSPVRAGGEKGAPAGTGPGWIRGRGITDERANYYHNTGLLRAFAVSHPLPDHDWAIQGRAARAAGPRVVEKGSVGFFGYFAGPQVHVVDLLGLGDPLMARLPLADPDWYIGHFGRLTPAGYIETLETCQNRIADPNLAHYYDKLAFVIRGDLFDPQRLVEIWKFNTGAYDAALDAYSYFRGTPFMRAYTVTNPTDRPYVYAYLWNNQSGATYLLDDASARGRAYRVSWEITREGVQYTGAAAQQLSTIGPLSDQDTLHIGVLFSPNPDMTAQDMFEYRYWFRFEPDGALTVVLPGKGFHNADAPQGFWATGDIRDVMREP